MVIERMGSSLKHLGIVTLPDEVGTGERFLVFDTPDETRLVTMGPLL